MLYDANVTTTTEHHALLTRDDIIHLVMMTRRGLLGKQSKDVDVFVQVPTGGDFSGCRFDIDNSADGVVIHVVWKTVEEK